MKKFTAYVLFLALAAMSASISAFPLGTGVLGVAIFGDTDGDLVVDTNDAFPNDPSEQVDADNDGIGDVADTDDDNDGVNDSVDVYPLISLGALADTDGDGVPNSCNSTCIGLGMAADIDDDNDGVFDENDAFPLDALYSFDADNDELPDEWEDEFGLDKSNERDAYFDLDQDGYLNWEEFLIGSDPSSAAEGPAQILYTNRVTTLNPSVPNRITVSYTTTVENPNLSGLGIRVHYDSSYVTSITLDNVFEQDFLLAGEPQSDLFDFDGDLATDTYLTVAWASIDGANWPGRLNIDLFEVVLLANEKLAELAEYAIRFSVTDTPAGYRASVPSIYSPVVLASLDIDGDGEVKALTDGLMIIRRLFGFSGPSLSDGAVSDNAEFTSASDLAIRIDAFSAALDVDADGETKALTDGLMIIRRLFGFSGPSLTAGAVSGSATRTDSADIAAYIDSLLP